MEQWEGFCRSEAWRRRPRLLFSLSSAPSVTMSISNGLHPHRDDATDDEDDGDDGSAAHDAYYHPISAFDDGSDPNSDSDAASPIRSNGGALSHLQNPDPSFLFLDAESGISALDLNGGGDGVGGSSGGLVEVVEDEEAEEESARQREVSISRAFREDERRRSAPLTPENAARVLDAMRGVAFQGVPPDWAGRVPEDQWVDRLRRMRESSFDICSAGIILCGEQLLGVVYDANLVLCCKSRAVRRRVTKENKRLKIRAPCEDRNVRSFKLFPWVHAPPLLLTYFTFPTSHWRFGPRPSFRGCITGVDKSMFGLEELVVVEKEESRTPSSGEGGTLKAALQLAAQLVRHHIHRYS